MRKIFVILLCLISAVSIYSQSYDDKYMSVAVRIGVGTSSLKGLEDYKKLPLETTKNFMAGSRFSWDVGVTIQYGIKNGFFYQTECTLGIMGASLDGAYRDGGNYKTKVNSVDLTSMQLSVSLGKKVTTINRGLKLFVALGAYVDYDLGIDLIYDLDKSTVLNGHDANFKSWDFGAVASGGLQYRQFQLSFNPRFGLVNISPNESKIYHRGYKFVFSYYFPGF